MQLFITATGTDIGKTFISSIILSYFHKIGRNFKACKPLMSGVEELQNCDAALLLKAMSQKPNRANIENISPWIFAQALSPHRAAELSDASLNYEMVLAWCKNWLKANYNGLIEGAGGVYVPINYEKTQLDLMTDLQIPAVLVCGDYLGTISHTLTALQALKQRNISLNAIIINQSLNCVDHEGSKRSIAAFSPYAVPILSFCRHADDDIMQWNSNQEWQMSKIYQNNRQFFAYLDRLV
jgi:dethiobiotin synthetase